MSYNYVRFKTVCLKTVLPVSTVNNVLNVLTHFTWLMELVKTHVPLHIKILVIIPVYSMLRKQCFNNYGFGLFSLLY